MPKPFFLAQGSESIFFDPRMGNRHGLIAGATGTGKTVSLRVLAENFSALGIPVFLSDVKGDLSGIARAGTANLRITEKLRQIPVEDFAFAGFPVTFWDVFGVAGHPVRATISELGPLLLARVLGLNETQEGVLSILFRIADDHGLLLLDLEDLREMLRFLGENAAQFTTKYGNISAASVGAIQRGLLQLEQQGADKFFGEPALNLDDLVQTGADGHGMINVLVADQLLRNPRVYATALLWLLSELFERLPEVGDVDKPKLVFFFDEAHLLFDDLPRAFSEKIEQVVRLIRSKGVGIYFITQNPLDIPDSVLGQLGNRIQHALRAFTPRDQKAVRSAAETFRQNPSLDVAATITELAVGEALVSLLDETGTPGVVQRAFIAPPRSQLPPLTPAERQQVIESSVLFGTYEKTVDRESAAEKLQARTGQIVGAASPSISADAPASQLPPLGGVMAPAGGGSSFLKDLLLGSSGPRGGRREGMIESVAKSTARSMAGTVGREIIRGVLGSMFGGGRRR